MRKEFCSFCSLLFLAVHSLHGGEIQNVAEMAPDFLPFKGQWKITSTLHPVSPEEVKRAEMKFFKLIKATGHKETRKRLEDATQLRVNSLKSTTNLKSQRGFIG